MLQSFRGEYYIGLWNVYILHSVFHKTSYLYCIENSLLLFIRVFINNTNCGGWEVVDPLVYRH